MRRASQRPYRGWLPLWVWILLAAVGGIILWVQVLADLGDSGLANVATMATLAAAVLVLTPWFLFFSRFRRRTRLWTALAAVVLVTAFLLLFRVDSFSGALVPQVAWRAGAGEPEAPEGQRSGDGIDLRTTTDHDFPGFLGADRSMAVPGIQLALDWQEQPPELIWRQPIGAGWSAFAVVHGFAVTMEQRGDVELVTAYDLMTGELQWAQSNPGRFEHPLGGTGPRSTPLIDDGRVYALTAEGVLLCLDGATGSVLWRHDLLAEYDVTPLQEFANIMYGRSNSPLVVGDRVIIPAGGNPVRPPVSLVAYDKRTGQKIWEAGDRQISFSSPRLAAVAGVEQILILNEDAAAGYDPATGRTLWEHPWPGRTSANATASQAKPLPPDRVFLSKGYGEGAAVVQLIPRGDGTFEARELWHNRRVLRTKFTNVAFRDGYAYGLSNGILECVDLANGRRAWKGGRYGHGQILLTGNALLVLTEDGELVLVEPTPERANHVLGRFQALDHSLTWNNLALYGPYLAVRNARQAAVYRLALAGD